MRRRAWLALVAVGLLGPIAGCEELGNPMPGTTGGAAQLVRESPSPYGTLITEVRYVAPEQAPALLRAVRDEVDHMDAGVPPGGALVVVMVRPAARGELPPFLHLTTDFAYPNGTAERRVWVARTTHARFVALFGLRAVPIEVRTTTL